jgi:alpha-amylase
MLQAFEWYIDGGGIHWKRIEKLVPELASMGMTAMWLPRTDDFLALLRAL